MVKRDPVGNVMILDQSQLPGAEKWLSLSSADDVCACLSVSPRRSVPQLGEPCAPRSHAFSGRVAADPRHPAPRSQVADAIRRNTLLGSSAIGLAAAYGLACGARKLEDIGFEEVRERPPLQRPAERPQDSPSPSVPEACRRACPHSSLLCAP